ncbi:hypothetical protein BKA66DRAFT_545771 [Pyrenochaeta sp. MPI-SDFR-AT-0127]|nr:hypothetical protein BKA66DRAFT_545771 [Pyrenochaeta sp. MPI-SDFR-AT-0127]
MDGLSITKNVGNTLYIFTQGLYDIRAELNTAMIGGIKKKFRINEEERNRAGQIEIEQDKVLSHAGPELHGSGSISSESMNIYGIGRVDEERDAELIATVSVGYFGKQNYPYEVAKPQVKMGH